MLAICPTPKHHTGSLAPRPGYTATSSKSLSSRTPGALTEGRDGAAPSPPPAVGWLWDKKAADTRKVLQQNNLRPKK
jgi:hypothetical protein